MKKEDFIFILSNLIFSNIPFRKSCFFFFSKITNPKNSTRFKNFLRRIHFLDDFAKRSSL